MLTYNTAHRYATELKNRLSPFVKKAEIAGSIRRRKPQDIKDIEIVCIPEEIQVIGDLFSQKTVRVPGFINWVNQWNRIKGDPEEGKYCQREIIPGVILDLFIADEDNFGWQYLLRTGPSEFNINIILPRLKDRGVLSVDGYLTRDGERIPVSREEEVFALAEMDFIPANIRPLKKYCLNNKIV